MTIANETHASPAIDAPEAGSGNVDAAQRRNTRSLAILANLDDAQRAAAELRGPALVLGPAGSGRTRVLAHRIAAVCARGDVPPRRILGFARSEREAMLLRARAERLLNAPLHGAWIDTPQEICLRILRAHAAALGRKPSFVVLGESEARVLVRGAARDADVSEYSAARLQEIISLAKVARRVPDGPVGDVYEKYEAALRAANAFDADDLLRHVLELLDPVSGDAALMAKYRRRFSHIVIDDFEDAGAPHRELFVRLVGPDGDVLASADDDQAIASAALGEPDARAAFLATFPAGQIVHLARSYRSSGRITLLAARIAARNAPPGVERHAPEAMKKRGRRVVSAVFADENDEAVYVVRWLHRVARRLGAPLARVAILYRHPVQARPFEEALARFNVPYRVVGQPRFYERREVKDVIAYLKLTVGGGDPAALARIANVPRRGIGPASVATIARLQHRGRSTMAEAALQAASLPRVTAQRAGALADLGRLLTDLTDAARRMTCAELIDFVIERSGYGRLLGELSRSEEETRREGIDELRGLARATPGPAATSLASLFARVDREDVEPPGSGKGDDGVQLLTFAEAKGRDFDVVFMTGLEEGLLPGARAVRLGDAAIQGERRLFYVGITRARSRLVFTRALARTIFGRPHPGEPSRFLAEAGKKVRAFRLGHARLGQAAPRARETSSSAAEPAVLTSVREGQRVVHPTYGPGVVVRLEPGTRPMVTVAFDGAPAESREKRLALAFARLQPA